MIVLSLFSIIGFQWARYTSILDGLLEIDDVRSALYWQCILSCICVTCIFILKRDKLTFGSLMSTDANIMPIWAIPPIAIIIFVAGAFLLMGWTNLDYTEDPQIDEFKPYLSVILFSLGIGLSSLGASYFSSWAIATISTDRIRTNFLKKYPWSKISRILVENRFLEREDKQLKKQFDNLIKRTIHGQIICNIFQFEDELWDMMWQREKIIDETVEVLVVEFFAIQREWDGDSDRKKLNNYVKRLFSETITKQQLSHYTNISLSEKTTTEASIRNLLCFFREKSDDSQTTPSNFFISDELTQIGLDAENSHYFRLKMAIAAFFAYGLKESGGHGFEYDLFKRLIQISMKDSRRNDCPPLGNVGFETSRNFNGINDVLDWQLCFSDVDQILDDLKRYINTLSLYGYTFPDLSRDRNNAELDHTFWDHFWKELKWKRT